METNNTEIWVDIDGYEGLYQVSTHGRVKNNKDKILKTYLVNGYERVDLNIRGERKKWRLHRLVALNLVPIPDRNEHLVVNHIDSNRINNHANNLEWVSMCENNTHAHLNKERSSSYPGVYKRPDRKKETWRAEAFLNGKKYSIGSYPTEEEAINARKQFDLENGRTNKYAEI